MVVFRGGFVVVRGGFSPEKGHVLFNQSENQIHYEIIFDETSYLPLSI